MTKQQVIVRVGKEAVIDEKPDSLGGLALHLRTVPKPYEAFGEYLLLFSDSDGLLKVLAFSRNIDTARDGTELRREYDSLKGPLSTSYGLPNTDVDYLKAGSL